jgi:hypothetical protein
MTWLVLNPEKLAIAIGPGNDVFVQLQYPHDQTGLAPGSRIGDSANTDSSPTICSEATSKGG